MAASIHSILPRAAIVVALIGSVVGVGLYLRRAHPYAVPADEDIFAVVQGRWAWTTQGDGCAGDWHRIDFSSDRSMMTITSSKPYKGANGALDSVATYDVLSHSRSWIRGAMRGETRLTRTGQPVVWDLVLRSHDSYAWHRTDWLFGGHTAAIRRCPEPATSTMFLNRGWMPPKGQAWCFWGSDTGPRFDAVFDSARLAAFFGRLRPGSYVVSVSLPPPDSEVPAGSVWKMRPIPHTDSVTVVESTAPHSQWANVKAEIERDVRPTAHWTSFLFRADVTGRVDFRTAGVYECPPAVQDASNLLNALRVTARNGVALHGDATLLVLANGSVGAVDLGQTTGQASLDTLIKRGALQARYRPGLINRVPVPLSTLLPLEAPKLEALLRRRR